MPVEPATSDADPTPRRDFRVLTRRRTGYEGVMVDVQLQVTATGALVWSQTFSDDLQADEFQQQVEADLDALDIEEFRRRYSVPSTV